MAAIEINLTKREHAFIEDAVASGEFVNEADVIHAALGLLAHAPSAIPWTDEELVELAQVALEQVAQGDYTELSVDELDAFMDDIEGEIDGNKAA